MDQFLDNSIPYYWSGSHAIHHLLDALQELENLLRQLISIHAVHADMALRMKNRRKSRDKDETVDSSFEGIIDELWALEEKIRLKAELACLMSAIQTEDNLNAFIVFNREDGSKDNFRKKSLLKKRELASKVVGGNLLVEKEGLIFQAFKRLSEWRNAFAHGHCTGRPATESLRDNHQTRPKEYINVPMELKNTIDSVSDFLLIDDYLRSISKHQFIARVSNEVEKIRYKLTEIKRFTVEGSGSTYSISCAAK